MPAIKGAEATLSEAVKEGSDMKTLYYAVAAQTYLGLKGKGVPIICILVIKPLQITAVNCTGKIKS